MRIAATAVVGLVLALGGAAAASAVTGPSAASARVVHAQAAVVKSTPQSAYLTTMRGLLVGQKRSDQTDAELVASAKSLCANEVASGLTWRALDEQVAALGESPTFYRAYVLAAVTAYCPTSLPAMG